MYFFGFFIIIAKMNEAEKIYFAKLKVSLSEKLRLDHPLVPEDIKQWKSKEIALFQEELLEKVNGRISEKWFYTHIKSEHKTLPRIDILDLLSSYLNYTGWSDFKNNHRLPIKNTRSNNFKKYLMIGAGFIIITSVILISISGTSNSYKDYQFCFVDQYTGLPVTDQPLSIVLLHNLQSPAIIRVDEQGCIKSKSNSESLKFIIRSPYYSSDTIIRDFSGAKLSEVIEVKPNDYTLIIHLFSSGKVSEWQDRRQDLDNMFHDNARIYQVFSHSSTALAIYNKDEFINKLILPTGTLKNLEILGAVYKEDKISVLRFKKGKDEK